MKSNKEKPLELEYDREKTAKLLFARLKHQSAWIWLWFLVLILSATVDILLITMVRDFTDNVIAQENRDLIFTEAKRIVTIIVFLMFSKGILKGGEYYLTNLNGQKLIVNLRRDIFNHLQKLGLDFFESRRTGTIMSWITTDVLRIREFAGKLLAALVQGPILIIGSLGLMIYTSWQLTVTSLIVIPPIVLVVHAASKLARRAAANVQQSLADVSGELQEGISAIQVVKSFARETWEIIKFGKYNMGAFTAEMNRAKIEAILAPMLSLFAGLGLSVLILVGSWQTSVSPDGTTLWNVIRVSPISPGDLVLIIFLLHKTYEESNKLGRTWMSFQDTLAASDRIFGFLDIKPSIVDEPDAVEIDKCSGLVEFRNVSFTYPTGDEVLKNITVKAEPGQVKAFVGPSGAGKSTIAKLIPRFYDVDSGEVLIDGIDVRKLRKQSLREQLGIVPQETILFHGTVRENIAYGKLEASDEEIREAARKANAHDFIMQLEHQYNTIVGERGTKLSGGQRQRISIARAILKDPRILILDEATSNLDTESEKLVQAALEILMEGRTTFVIAHRLSTIRNASEIIVLRAGEIVDRGTHGELMSRSGLYRELYTVEETG